MLVPYAQTVESIYIAHLAAKQPDNRGNNDWTIKTNKKYIHRKNNNRRSEEKRYVCKKNTHINNSLRHIIEARTPLAC